MLTGNMMLSLNITAFTVTGVTSYNIRSLINLSAHIPGNFTSAPASLSELYYAFNGVNFPTGNVLEWIEVHVMQPNCL